MEKYSLSIAYLFIFFCIYSDFFHLAVDKRACYAYNCSEGITEQILRRKACPDKCAEKLNIPQTDNINKVDILQKLHQKCKKHYSDVSDIRIFTADYCLYKAVNRPYNDNISAVVSQPVAVLCKGNYDLYCNQQNEDYYIWQSFFHNFSF